MPSRRNIEPWPEGENSFATDPPNAVLSFIAHEGKAPQDAVVMLADHLLTGDVLTRNVEVRECVALTDPWGARPPSTRIFVIGAEGAVDGDALRAVFDGCRAS